MKNFLESENSFLKENKNNDWEKLFLFTFLFWSISFSIMNTTVLQAYVPRSFLIIVRLLCFFNLGIKEIGTIKSIDIRWFLGVLFMGMMLISSIVSNNSYMFDMAFFIFSSRNIDFKKILSCYKKWFGIFVFIIIGLSLFGLIEDRVYFQENRIRHSLGFNYTSFASQYIFFLTLSTIATLKKYKFIDLCFWFILNLWVFLQTNTKFPFYLSIVFIIISYIFLNKKSDFRIVKKILNYCFPFSFIFILLLTYFYDNGNMYMYKLNRILSGRLTLGNQGINEYGIHFLGNKIRLLGGSYFESGNSAFFESYNYIDSGYIQTLLIFGSLFTIFYVIGMSYVMNKHVNKLSLSLALLFVSIHAMFDPQLFYLWYSPFILLLGKIFNSPKIA